MATDEEINDELLRAYERWQDADALLDYADRTSRLTHDSFGYLLRPWKWRQWWRTNREIGARIIRFRQLEEAYDKKWKEEEE